MSPADETEETADHVDGSVRVVPVVVWAFGIVTALIWTTRIRNIADDDLTGYQLAVRLSLAVWMSLLGIALVVAAFRSQRLRQRLGSVGVLTRSLAVATVVVWVWRALDIAVQSRWSLGFKVVHTLLAVGSISLAVAARRSVSRGRRQATA